MYNSNQIFRIPRQDEDQLLDVCFYLANFKKLLVDAHVKKFVLFTTSPIGMYFSYYHGNELLNYSLRDIFITLQKKMLSFGRIYRIFNIKTIMTLKTKIIISQVYIYQERTRNIPYTPNTIVTCVA